MRSLIIILLSLVSTISFALADYSVTSPGSGSTWNKGDKVTVKWTVLSNSDSTVNVYLAKGAAVNLQRVATLCSGVGPNVGKCQYTVGSLTSGVDYAIIVGNDPNHYGYSSYCMYLYYQILFLSPWNLFNSL